MKPPRCLILFVAVALLGACAHAPVVPSQVDAEGFQEINASFVASVDKAYADPNREWEHGWWGNMWIGMFGGKRYGLCWQWRDWVYDEVIETVHGVGWEAHGVGINLGYSGEHHAVVVYNPEVIPLEELLPAAPETPAWVLDGWANGKAEVYTLYDWTDGNHVGQPELMGLPDPEPEAPTP